MNVEKLKIFLKEYRWVILASVFFIAWKFFLIGVMWDDRLIPPEPDDSYEYIAHIASVSECETGLLCRYTGVSITDHSGFAYLSYRIILGLIGKILHLNQEETFHCGFYLGTILLAAILIPFLRALTQDKRLIAWSILFLSLYHGTGEAHGFFWVVPSFFSTALFLLLFSFISTERKNHHWWQFILIGFTSIIFAFSHPISIYLGLLFVLYVAVLFFLSRNIQKEVLFRLIFVTFIIFFSSLAQERYLSSIAQTSYYGPEHSILQAKNDFKDITHGNTASEYNITHRKNSNIVEQRLLALHTVYFRYIIPHWIAIVPFLCMLFVIFFRKNFKLISIYIASFAFFIATTLLHEFGFRSAVILWPITFTVYAFGSWYLLDMTKNISSTFLKNTLKTAIIIGIAIFLLVNASLSFVFNNNINTRNNYFLDDSFSAYLSDNMRPEDKANIPGILLRTSAGAHFFLEQKISPIENRPAFIVIIDKSNLPKEETQSAFSHIISKYFSLYARTAQNKSVEASIRKKDPLGYFLCKEYGIIKIYQRNQ